MNGETLAERARRAAERERPAGPLAERAARAAGEPSQGVPRESLRLDVRAPSESTRALPYDPSRPGDLEALRSAPKGALPWLKEGAGPAAALTLTAAQGIPGMEAFQSAAGALGSQFTDNPMSFRESRDVLRETTSQIPPEVRAVAKLAGGAAVLPLMAGFSPLKAGATLGAADQALSAEDMSLTERGTRAVAGGAVGGLLGKAAEVVGVAGRAGAAQPLGKNAMARKEALAAADNAAYGLAAREAAAAGGTNRTVSAVLKHPKIAPFTAAVRGTEQFKGASDAEVLMEVYRQMGTRQRQLGRVALSADDYRAGTALEKGDIEQVKQLALNAMDTLTPAFRKAVQQHARMAAEVEAFERGADVTTRIVNKNAGAAAKLDRRSPESFAKRIAKMSPEERQSAIEGMLARLRERIGIQPNAVSMGGLLTTAIRPARVAPYLRQLGGKAQDIQDEIIRAALLMGASGTK